MKHIFLTMSALCAFHYGIAHAQLLDQIGQSTGSSIDEPLDAKTHSYSLGIRGGISETANSLSSNGIKSVNLPSKRGVIGLFDFSHENFSSETKSKVISSLGVDYFYQTTKYTGLPNVSPSNVTMTYQKASLSYVSYLSKGGMFERFGFEAGYSYHRRSAGTTSPTLYLSNTEMHAVDLGFRYSILFSQRFSVKIRVVDSLPFYFKETPVQTGARKFSVMPFGDLVFKWDFFDNASFLFGAFARYEKHFFDGTGSRGVSQGVDKTFSYGIPLGISISF